MTTVANLEVLVTANTTGLTTGVAKANTSLNTMGASATKTGGLLGKLGSMGPLMGGLIATGVIVGVKALIDMGAEAQRIAAQTEARIKSTGGVANVTAAGVTNLATAIRNYSGVSVGAVKTAENMLLTFTNIRNEAGAGNDIFDQTTVAVTDMAVAMANGATPSMEEMSTTSIRIGKALNDPIKGLTALSKVGVSFTAEQKAMITAMVEGGDVMGAQKIILAELTTEFGGSAAALGGTFTGQWNIMVQTVMSAVRAIAAAVLGMVTPILSAITPVLEGFAKFVAFVSAIAQAIIGFLTPAIGPILIGLAALAIAVGVAALAFIGLDAAAAPIVAALTGPVAIIAAIVAGFMLFVRVVQQGLAAVNGGFSKMGGIWKAVLIVLAPLWLPVVAVIKVVGVILKALGAVFSFIGKAAVAAWKPIGEAISFVGKMLGESIAWLAKAAGAVANWISEFVKGIPGVKQLGEIIGSIGAISAANAQTAAAEFRTMGLAVVVAAKTGSAATVEMTHSIEAMKATMSEGDFAKAMAAGMTAIDNQMKAGTISVSEATKAYLAWGLSSQQAAAKAQQGITAAAKATAAASHITISAADTMANAWAKVGPKAASSMAQITKAVLSAAKASANLAKNTNTVTDRLVNDYHLTADQAKTFLANATPKAIATMAKSGGKSFSQLGQAAQKLNGITPTVATGVDKITKSAGTNTKAVTTTASAHKKLADSVKTTAKEAQPASKGLDDVAKSAKQSGEDAGRATGDMKQLGGAMKQTGNDSASAKKMVDQLSTSLKNLPTNIKITVTVNVVKTGAQLGGVVNGLATGGRSKDPLTLVGERGPELAALPPGTRVFSHTDTMGMLANVMRSPNDVGASSAGGGSQGAGGPVRISGRLTLVNGDAYIEGVILDTLQDGRVVDKAMTKAMGAPER